MKRHPFTVNDLWALPRVGGPVPSPDGARLVVPVTTYDMETNEGTVRLWLVPAAPGEARPLTAAGASGSQPAWSPDGGRLAFVRKPGGEKKKKSGPEHTDESQLHVLSLAGGEPERLTDLPFGAAAPRWFPDGKRIAFLSRVFGEAPSLEKTAKLKKERDEDPVKAHASEDRIFRYWDRWLTDGLFEHIFVLDLETRAILDLTPGSRRWFDFMESEFSISPDGREIAFAACRSAPPYDPLAWGVFTVKVPARTGRAGSVRLISSTRFAHAGAPAYSPDGRYIIYGAQREIDFYADRVRLVAYDRAKRAHRVLTEAWDFSASDWSFGDDPKKLYLRAEVDARTAIFVLDLPPAMRAPAAHPPRELVRGGTFSAPRAAGGSIFASRSSLCEPPEVYRFSAAGAHPRRLTRFTDDVMRRIEVSHVEDVRFAGAGGDEVQMFLMYPPGERPTRRARTRYPLVQMIHGGPHGISGDQFHWRWNALAFAAPGYLVAMVNFHGSTSWGQDFAASILGRWGDQPYADIMAATDHLIGRGLVDPKRMAATGGSYGGYLVSWIASRTDRFACLINHAGVCDLQTQYASDVTQGRMRALGGEPWDRLEGLDRYNPMRHAAGFSSPMLVIHGEKDYRVPHAQGIEIYNVYKAKRLPARLVVFPDENHWVLKPRNSVLWYREFLGWLERWLGRRRRPRGRARSRGRR